jgi:hypothetical protein
VLEILTKEWHKTSLYHQHLLPQVEFLKGIDLHNPALHVVYFEHMAAGMHHFFEEMTHMYPQFAKAVLRRDNDTADVLSGSELEKQAKIPWREFYTSQPDDVLQKAVVQMYDEDFKTFGYSRLLSEAE